MWYAVYLLFSFKNTELLVLVLRKLSLVRTISKITFYAIFKMCTFFCRTQSEHACNIKTGRANKRSNIEPSSHLVFLKHPKYRIFDYLQLSNAFLALEFWCGWSLISVLSRVSCNYLLYVEWKEPLPLCPANANIRLSRKERKSCIWIVPQL